MALNQLAIGAMGFDPGMLTMTLAVQAKASGIEKGDFDKVCALALKYGLEFDAATTGGSNGSVAKQD